VRRFAFVDHDGPVAQRQLDRAAQHEEPVVTGVDTLARLGLARCEPPLRRDDVGVRVGARERPDGSSLLRAGDAAKIYRKSGTWRQWHSDSALVRDPDWRNYILVALVESPNGEAILRNLVPMIEDILVQKRRLAQR
jgi:hypothetical protein